MSITNKVKTVGRYVTAGSLGIAGINPNIAFNEVDKKRNFAVGEKIKKTAKKLRTRYYDKKYGPTSNGWGVGP